jgi:hypothetical protein
MIIQEDYKHDFAAGAGEGSYRQHQRDAPLQILAANARAGVDMAADM